MSSLPKPVSQHLATYHIQALAPAWVELKKNTELVIQTGGEWHHYFSNPPNKDDNFSSFCCYLQGMLPVQESFELPQMQLNESNQYTDILAFHGDASDWIIFCDVTQSTLQLQEYQQAANELNLLKDQLKQTLGRYVGHEVADLANQGKLQLNIAGERRVISTLFVDIRGFTSFNEKHDAQEVMNTLNQYMECMLTPIMKNAGMVDKIMGDGVMAIFGIIPSQKSCVDDAFLAANIIQKCVKELNKKRGNQKLEQLGVGVGIATGDAVLGILGLHERRTFTAIGRHVNLAARLESSARVGEILIDEATLSSMEKPKDYQVVTLELKGIGKTHAFSFMPH